MPFGDAQSILGRFRSPHWCTSDRGNLDVIRIKVTWLKTLAT
ncbi:hypothetical protein RISK_003817 [Rhodopirellula islandica]|uniref:Uncharacterized protein n=1 Tax=Rhodopirellula islandica TaxID=595434 RepID=A0A0J1BCJ8_RHOIS|nr:hypothetical protein RISK_003817 [Rhodopirellula islandica]